MLEINFILENKDIVKRTIETKKGDYVDIDEIERLHNKRVELSKEVEEINRQKNIAAEARDSEQGKLLKEKLQPIEEELRDVSKNLTKLMSAIPNIPSPDVPIGEDENDNVEIRSFGKKREFNFTPKAHWQIGEERDLIDSKRAAKVSGSRFTYLKGDLVMLQFALIKWVLDTVTNERILKDIITKNNFNIPSTPFIPVLPPVMVPPEVFFGMARLDPQEDKYFLEKDNLFLVGSAEHSTAPMHLNEKLKEEELPIRYIGYSTSFRREAGSYGKDTKGILRQHQFDKIEFATMTTGEKSKTEQDFLVAIQEHLMQQLDLPYRVMLVCSGDMGKPDIRQIDIETWMPGENLYRETHSADLTGEYQSRRLGIKVARLSGENEFVHLNDATVFALGRILIAIIENNQQEDGKILIPEVLQPYMQNNQYI